ncbi:hypothetical protein BRW65_11085 [Mycobacterium paraffinicum]|uniref:Uncharacterized protein n=1 Tax=Mycobacterium paraffinicum TaxID=53378 RepID=A0A1Q4HWF1_9MYCO|nr:hypothetical protein BRW65_11085 [Mycobacterium paraffinicum]
MNRVLYNVNEWDTAPAKFVSGGRKVRLDGYRRQPVSTVEVLGLNSTRVALLVVSPGADPAQAHAVMMTAAGPSNASTVEGLLMTSAAEADTPT